MRHSRSACSVGRYRGSPDDQRDEFGLAPRDETLAVHAELLEAMGAAGASAEAV
jgi:hypothetical protein